MKNSEIPRDGENAEKLDHSHIAGGDGVMISLSEN